MRLSKNKYARWYKALIKKAKQRKALVGYFEQHHIVPKSLGGNDCEKNLVLLTAREHFLAHLLLVKIASGLAKRKMAYALSFMLTHSSKLNQRHAPTSRWYEYSRKLLSETQRGRVFTAEARNKMRASQIKRYENAEERAAVSKWTKNPSKETRQKIGQAARNRSVEALEKMRAAKSRKCTIDGGKTIFKSRKELGKTLGWGKTGTGSPAFEYV